MWFLAILYNTVTNISDQLSREDLYKSLSCLINNKFKGNEEYLDFGSGTASLSMIFLPFVKTMWLLDFANESQRYIQYKIRIKKLKNIKILTPDSLSQINDHSLDIVLLIDVLEHLNNPSTIFKNIDLKIKPGGYLVFRAPWGDTFFGRHPDHKISAQNDFNRNGGDYILRNKYTHISSISILDLMYNQGIFQKNENVQ